jgi:hypothetical protein
MRLAPAFSLAFSLALPLCAEHPWQSRPYADWTEREAKQVLSDSPWAKQTEARLSTPPGFSTPGNRSPLGDGIHGSIGGTIGTYGTRGVDGEVGADGREPAPSAISTPVTVRWESALPVRQAELKLHQEAQSAEEPVYVIAILGLPREIEIYNPQELRSRAFLKIKGRKRIPAADVKIVMPEDKPVVLLVFPKTQRIAPGDKEIEFTMNGVLELRQKFTVKEMICLGELEL